MDFLVVGGRHLLGIASETFRGVMGCLEWKAVDLVDALLSYGQVTATSV